MDDQKSSLKDRALDVIGGRHLRSNPTDRLRFWCGWIGVLFALVTVFVLVSAGAPTEKNSKSLKDIALPFLVIWTVVPPMYFWLDYFVLWHIESRNNTTQFATLDEFKHGQELSRNLWLAIVALLVGIYFK